MRATAEIQVEPIGVDGARTEQYVRRAITILDCDRLDCEVTAEGATIAGSLEDVLFSVRQIHRDLHRAGVGNLVTSVRLRTSAEDSDSAGTGSSATGLHPGPAAAAWAG